MWKTIRGENLIYFLWSPYISQDLVQFYRNVHCFNLIFLRTIIPTLGRRIVNFLTPKWHGFPQNIPPNLVDFSTFLHRQYETLHTLFCTPLLFGDKSLRFGLDVTSKLLSFLYHDAPLLCPHRKLCTAAKVSGGQDLYPSLSLSNNFSLLSFWFQCSLGNVISWQTCFQNQESAFTTSTRGSAMRKENLAGDGRAVKTCSKLWSSSKYTQTQQNKETKTPILSGNGERELIQPKRRKNGPLHKN